MIPSDRELLYLAAVTGMTEPSRPRAAPGDGLPRTFIFDLRLLNPAEGLRSGLAIASVLILAEWVHLPGLVWAALAAWLACLVDPGGPLRGRLVAQGVFAAAGAVITALVGLLVAALPIPVTVLLGAAGIFAFAMLRALGAGGMQLGIMLSLVLVLALRQPVTELREAAIAGAQFLAGASWAALLTALLWRIHPFQTARGAVAGCWRAMGRLTDDLRELLRTPGCGPDDWIRHAREHRRDVRLALEDARSRVLAYAAALRDAAWRLDPTWQRLGAAEQVFDALVALGDLLEQDDAPPTRVAAMRLLDALAPLLAGMAAGTAANRAVGPVPRGELMALTAAAPDCAALRPIVARLLDGLDAAAAPGADTDWRDRTAGTTAGGWRAIRAQMHRGAPILRHASRLAAAAAAAFTLTLGWPVAHDYWLTIALLMTLQPDVATTLARAAERIGGTMVGATVGAVVALLLPSAMSMAFAVLVLAVPTAAMRRVSFGIFVAGVSAVVVVLLQIDMPGQAEALHIALQRALYTLVGGGFALVCAVALWPDWAAARLDATLRIALMAYLRYARLAVAQMLGETSEAVMLEARRTVGQTSAEAEEVLQRALLEHARSRTVGLGAALGVDDWMRRAGGRIASLRLGVTLTDRVAAQAWRDWFDAAALALNGGAGELPPRPGVEAEPALAEIGRQLDLAAQGLARLREVGARL
ncbi:FUSC family protein [Neoroseomonas lacus]|uniref:Integral membrane bound transporter domain-containing protein n=1 Tax=Neoroseomonas lacus TaxID=287609 RepID=A0A917L304_9PROT|nr:FUSC family protein [Neoroseomonas lacus]GGJ37311.1 hypothetical protein GCM10011320_51200 [Neoroseomonas lacus]